MVNRFRSEISRVFWCDPNNRSEPFQPATLPSVMRADPAKGTCWFDELFEGGIVLPDWDPRTPRALTILLSGPPGTGKSTLATEFCVRAACPEVNSETFRSDYVTVEAHGPWKLKNAESFDWKGAATSIGWDNASTPIRIIPARNENELRDHLKGRSMHDSSTDDLLNKISYFLGYRNEGPSGTSAIASDRQILVIDSLNTVEAKTKGELFSRLMSLVSSGHRIIILILDSDTGTRVWDFACDIVIRLDREYSTEYLGRSTGYLVRTLEIVKARYQSHVWGKHQLKIYEPFTARSAKGVPLSKEEIRRALAEGPQSATAVQHFRAHPYRNEGGVFIFPSIHYILSRYKTRSHIERPSQVPTPIDNLTVLLKGGFPRGRCIALVGDRGTHKSHLGYMHVLSRLRNSESERALIVSLRDDEGTTRLTLEKILQDWGYSLEVATQTIEKLQAEDRLEITYFPPGFITPEEFFHRLLLSIGRLKATPKVAGQTVELTVLFNSLDQLSSRFPLCAAQTIFIPGIIQMLSAEQVTSIFVGARAEADPQPTTGMYQDYGLLSVAELILSLDRQYVKRDDYLPWVKGWCKLKISYEELKRLMPERLSTVMLNVVRFAGGEPAGAKGMLELVVKGHPFFAFVPPGLQFIPWMRYPSDAPEQQVIPIS